MPFQCLTQFHTHTIIPSLDHRDDTPERPVNEQQQVSKPVYKVVVLQLFIAIAFASVAAFMRGAHEGWSAAYGGAIAVIGSWFYAMLVLGASADAERVLKAHVRAEMAKIFVTAVLFVLALVLFPSAAWLWLMLGFAVATLAYWFSLLLV
jgi:ATP synthase protein I